MLLIVAVVKPVKPVIVLIMQLIMQLIIIINEDLHTSFSFLDIFDILYHTFP